MYVSIVDGSVVLSYKQFNLSLALNTNYVFKNDVWVLTVFFTVELWHNPSDMSQLALILTWTKPLFSLACTLDYVLFRRKGKQVFSLCKWAADFALNKDFLCLWLIKMMLFFWRNNGGNTPRKGFQQQINFSFITMLLWNKRGDKTCPEGLNFVLVDFGRGRLVGRTFYRKIKLCFKWGWSCTQYPVTLCKHMIYFKIYYFCIHMIFCKHYIKRK